MNGYLASSTFGENSSSSPVSCPLSLKVLPGQRISLFIRFFGSHRRQHPQMESPIPAGPCTELIWIGEEGVHQKTITACDGLTTGPVDDRQVYLSRTNRIQVEYVAGRSNVETLGHFLLRYQGRCYMRLKRGGVKSSHGHSFCATYKNVISL